MNEIDRMYREYQGDVVPEDEVTDAPEREIPEGLEDAARCLAMDVDEVYLTRISISVGIIPKYQWFITLARDKHQRQLRLPDQGVGELGEMEQYT